MEENTKLTQDDVTFLKEYLKLRSTRDSLRASLEGCKRDLEHLNKRSQNEEIKKEQQKRWDTIYHNLRDVINQMDELKKKCTHKLGTYDSTCIYGHIHTGCVICAS